MATPVTLEGCAELRAEMESGHLRDDVLVRVGLGVEEWTAAQTEWLEKMGAEIERGRFELTNRYSQAFLERQRALRALATAPIEAPRAPAPPRYPAPASPASPAVATETPSFLLPVSPPIPAPIAPSPAAPGKARVPSQLGGTSMGFIVPKGAALPFARAPVAPPQGALPPGTPAAPPRPTVNRAPAALSGTSMGFIAPKGAALPFAKAPAPPAVAADATRPMAPLFAAPSGATAGLPFEQQPSIALDPMLETVTGLPSRSPLAPALPFGGAPAPGPAATKPAPPVVPPKAAPHAAPPAPDRDPMDMTTMGAMSPFARVMPFDAPPAPPTPQPAPAPAKVAPAPAAAPVIIGGYTLEQHVSLCADLTFTPARAAETLTRYRITPEGKAELDRLWKERFAADPALEARWREAHGMYLKFLGARRA